MYQDGNVLDPTLCVSEYFPQGPSGNRADKVDMVAVTFQSMAALFLTWMITDGISSQSHKHPRSTHKVHRSVRFYPLIRPYFDGRTDTIPTAPQRPRIDIPGELILPRFETSSQGAIF